METTTFNFKITDKELVIDEIGLQEIFDNLPVTDNYQFPELKLSANVKVELKEDKMFFSGFDISVEDIKMYAISDYDENLNESYIDFDISDFDVSIDKSSIDLFHNGITGVMIDFYSNTIEFN